MCAALYLRVSTTDQTTANQERELRAAAERMGHEVVEVYADNGISGAMGRDKGPAFDRLHRDAARRKFDIVMTWSVDRLGRSLQDLAALIVAIDRGVRSAGAKNFQPALEHPFRIRFANFSLLRGGGSEKQISMAPK
jgi:DNA invertase Pin-like site-specific DNA recombinase